MGQVSVSRRRIMKTVSIPPKSLSSASGWTASSLGIEMSRWCKEQGLMSGRDFDWAYHPEDYTVNFIFYGEAESFASLFALKWLPT